MMIRYMHDYSNSTANLPPILTGKVSILLLLNMQLIVPPFISTLDSNSMVEIRC